MGARVPLEPAILARVEAAFVQVCLMELHSGEKGNALWRLLCAGTPNPITNLELKVRVQLFWSTVSQRLLIFAIFLLASTSRYTRRNQPKRSQDEAHAEKVRRHEWAQLLPQKPQEA